MRITLVLHRGGRNESTATALALADRLLARGHRVSVFAHADAVTLSAGTGGSVTVVADLLRRGVAGAGVDWVVEEATARALGLADRQAMGVVLGDHADLWALVRQADVVLSPDGGS